MDSVQQIVHEMENQSTAYLEFVNNTVLIRYQLLFDFLMYKNYINGKINKITHSTVHTIHLSLRFASSFSSFVRGWRIVSLTHSRYNVSVVTTISIAMQKFGVGSEHCY